MSERSICRLLKGGRVVQGWRKDVTPPVVLQFWVEDRTGVQTSISHYLTVEAARETVAALAEAIAFVAEVPEMMPGDLGIEVQS